MSQICPIVIAGPSGVGKGTLVKVRYNEPCIIRCVAYAFADASRPTNENAI